MKNLVTIYGIVILLIATSCQKEVSFDRKIIEPVEKSFFIKNMVYKKGNSMEEYNYEYDEKGRVISAISPLPGGNKYFYKYNANNTYTVDIDDSSASGVRELNFINNLGFIDSTVSISNTSTSTNKFIYNDNMQIVKFKEYNVINSNAVLKNTILLEYDLNNDLIKQKNSNNDVEVLYTYYSSINSIKNGLTYYPPTPHLVKTSTYTGTRIVNATLTHTYTFDGSNRITSETATDNNGNVAISRNYKYN